MQKKRYKNSNIEFFTADLTKKVTLNKKFDVAISFNVFEHVKDPDAYLNTIATLLNKNGILIVETPNYLMRDLYQVNWNHFHFKEYTPEELKKYCLKYFQDVELVGLGLNNTYKKEHLIEKIKVERLRNGKQPSDSLLNFYKKTTPFWVKALYWIMQLVTLNLINLKEMYFIRDYSFYNIKPEEYGGIIAICKRVR